MKRWLLPAVLFLLFVACAESKDIPIKEVRSCSKVTKVELVKRPSPAWFTSNDTIYVKLTVADGSHFYNNTWDYKKWEGKGLLEIAIKMEMGKEYCWTTYEPIK